jgi:hypothetical protein
MCIGQIGIADIQIDVSSRDDIPAAIQSILVISTNQSVVEYWNFIFPAVLMNNELFFH